MDDRWTKESKFSYVRARSFANTVFRGEKVLVNLSDFFVTVKRSTFSERIEIAFLYSRRVGEI